MADQSRGPQQSEFSESDDGAVTTDGEPEFFQEMALAVDRGLVSITDTGTIVFVNPSFGEIIGHTANQLLGDTLLNLMAEQTAAGDSAFLRETLASADPDLEGTTVEMPLLDTDNSEVWVSIDFSGHTYGGQRYFTGLVEEISDQRGREHELERYENIITNLPLGIYRTETGQDGRFLEVNRALTEILGMESPDALIGRTPREFYTDPRKQDAMRQQIRADGILEDEELEIETEDGTRRLISVTAIEHDVGGESYIDGVITDLTGRKLRKRELRQQQETIEAIISKIPGVLFALDEDGVFTRSEGRSLHAIGLEPGEAVGESIYEMYADFPGILDDFRKALDGQQADDVVELQGRVFEVSFQPVLDDETVEHVVGFAYDITERVERERELNHQRLVLDRVKRILESLRPLHRRLTRASSREDIQQITCDTLSTSESYLCAWYGEYGPVTEQFTPEAWAGIGDRYFEGSSSQPVDNDPVQILARQAIRDRTVHVVQDILSNPERESWRDEALTRGYQSAAAVPVVFGETIYGVLGIYSARPDGFEDYEQELLRELGERIGHAIHAVENQRLLHTDTVDELRFTVAPEDTTVARVTTELGCELEFETILPATEQNALVYASVENADPASVVDWLDNTERVDHARVVHSVAETGLIEYSVCGTPVVTLLEYGATVANSSVTDGEQSIVAQVSPDTDIPALIANIQDKHPKTTFDSKTTRERPFGAITLSHDALDDILTDRQRECLQLAYFGGFFESPRHSTGEELAAALDVSSPTFYLHIRNAQRRILEAIDEMGLFDSSTSSGQNSETSYLEDE